MPLPPHAIVVRGGESALQTLRDNAEDTMAEEGVWGISAFVAAEDEPPHDVISLSELLDRLGPLIPHGKIRTSTVRRLQAGDDGYPVSSSPPPPHHVTIHLTGEPSDPDLLQLAARFDPPIARPNKEGQA